MLRADDETNERSGLRPWTLPALLAAMASRGDHPAVLAVHGEAVDAWSFAELARLSQRLASGLLADGLGIGEPVALWAANSAAWIVASLAIVAAGGIIVPIDDQAPADEALAFLADSGARRLFTTDAHREALRALQEPDDLAVFRLDDAATDARGRSWRSLFAAEPGPLPPVDPERPVSLFYTSGTTGSPKAFYLSLANVAANVEALSGSGVIRPGDRVLLPLPMHHVYPWVVGVLTCCANGLTLVLPEAATGPQIVHALQRGEATLVLGVPRLYEALAAGIGARAAAAGGLSAFAFGALTRLSRASRQRFGWNLGRFLLQPVRGRIAPKLRALVSGGAKLETAIIGDLEALGWDVYSGYGLAETSSTFTANFPRHKRLGSEGKPIVPGSEIRIADADETGTGEIQVRGRSVFAGYRNNPDANAAAFTADGWFRTGDLGRLDADGFVYVTGRAKEVIVLAGGKNVYPEDLEAAYAHPYIAEIAVLERAGALAALVRPNLEALRAAGVTRPEEAIRVALTAIGQGLPSFKRLSGFALAGEPLPRTRLGKFRRFLLPALFEQAKAGGTPARQPSLSAEDEAFLDRSPAREIWAILRASCGGRPLTLDASPQLDLGFDSFQWMSLAVDLQQRLGIRLTEDDIARIDTVRTLILLATERQSAARAAAEPEPRHPLPEPARGLWAVISAGLHSLNRLMFRWLFALRVEGEEHLPSHGPLLIAPNHVSDLDPFVLGAAVPARCRRSLFWAAEVTRLFDNRLWLRLCRMLQVFPVDERRPQTTLAAGAAALAASHILVWFPEAWRSPDGRLQHFLPGIGQLILDSRAPVIPVLIRGTFAAMPRGRRWPRRVPLTVVFGPPIAAETLLAGVPGEPTAMAVASELRARVETFARGIGASEVLSDDHQNGSGAPTASTEDR